MEADHPGPDETKPTASDEHDGPGVQTRSYDCSFCKRGFSNAQALGGHMNIHRKDRAKLKQPSPNQNQISADTSNDIVPSYPPPFYGYMPQPPLPRSDDGRFVSQWPWMAPSDQHHRPGEMTRTHDGSPQQLPLFMERPSRGYDQTSGSRGGEPQEEEEEEVKEIQRSDLGTDTTGLDLELRLGPEPTTDQKEFV